MKRNVKLLSTILTTGLLLTACGGSESASSAEQPAKDKISWMTMLHTATPPVESGGIEQALEDYTGVDIEFTWVPNASKNERINAALSSGELADIVQLTQIDNTTVRNSLKSGLFWDVEPYLSEFPNLASIPEDFLDLARVGGSVYGVPIQIATARYGVLVRKDWLDNLGLEVPHTIEELTEVARAFTEDDPDGNGIDDTLGFVDRLESYDLDFRSLSGYFGAGNFFAVTDEDEIIPSFMQPEFKEAMEWYRGIYQNGWMNSDFPVMPKADQRDYIATGRGGIITAGLFEAKNLMIAAEGTDQEAVMEWALINDITYKDVPRRIISDTKGGMKGWLAIPKSYVKTEDELRVVLKFINDLMDEEPYILMTEGIEGRHFEVVDGIYKRLDATAWQQEVQPFSSSRVSERVEVDIKYGDIQDEGAIKIAENEEFAITNPAQPLDSPTYNTEWSSLTLGIKDAYYKYMLGDIEMDGFDKAIETFLQNGGDKIIEEFTEEYRNSK